MGSHAGQAEAYSFFPAEDEKVTTVATNIAAVVTIPAVTGKQVNVLHYTVSVSAAPSAATNIQVVSVTSTRVMWREEISTDFRQTDVSFEKRPIVGDPSEAVTVTAGAVGGTTACTVSVSYIYTRNP